jgi:hypothetical protein
VERRSKFIAAAIAGSVFLILPGIRLYHIAVYKWQFNKAQALFEERCRTAGERIYRTVEGVEGIRLLNVRPADAASNRANRMWPGAALPDENGGDWYLISFLGWEQRQNGRHGPVNVVPTEYPGYRYIDLKGNDGSYVRYELIEVQHPTGKQWKLGPGSPVNQPSRYAVDFENLIDPKDRDNWIAGVRLKVLDTATGQLLAERLSFSFDPGLGSTEGHRAPWGFAIACPDVVRGAQTRQFAERVLKKPYEAKK